MGTTPNFGWPVPEATDLVKDGWEAIADLGDAIDTTVAGLGSGLTKITTATLSGSTEQVFTGLTGGSRYRLLMNTYGSVDNEILVFRFREGTTNKTASYYGASYYAYYTGTSAIYFNDNNANSLRLLRNSNLIDTQASTSIDIFITPNQNAAYITGTINVGRDNYALFVGGGNGSMATCDGFAIIPNSGTITGTATLYKYED